MTDLYDHAHDWREDYDDDPGDGYEPDPGDYEIAKAEHEHSGPDRRPVRRTGIGGPWARDGKHRRRGQGGRQ
jgi:hypothetical protein